MDLVPRALSTLSERLDGSRQGTLLNPEIIRRGGVLQRCQKVVVSFTMLGCVSLVIATWQALLTGPNGVYSQAPARKHHVYAV